MKLILTEAQHKKIISALYLAAEWEDSVAAVYHNTCPEYKQACRAAAEYRLLRDKLMPVTNHQS